MVFMPYNNVTILPDKSRVDAAFVWIAFCEKTELNA